MARGTPAGRIEAAAVLGSLGDEAGVAAICRTCHDGRPTWTDDDFENVESGKIDPDP